MAKRRPRGEGSVRYDASRKAWVGRVPAGRGATGRTRYVQVQAPTQAECLRRMRAAKQPGPAATVRDWAERWLKSLSVRTSTRAGYEFSLRAYVLPAWGHLKLLDVTPSRVEQLAAEMSKSITTNSALLVLAHARVMLNAAVRDGLIPSNPVSRARKPKKTKKKIDPFPPADLARIVAACSTPNERPLALMAAIGCRIGEAVALEVADWDGERVSITKTMAKGGVGPPKSENGIRTVRVPAAARPALDAAKGDRTTGPLFPGELAARVPMNGLRAAWAALLKRLDLRPRNPHQLRHSVATAAIGAGMPLANVARDLGDAVDTLVKTYLHPVAGCDLAATMDGLFGG